jgi:hypothetical protein
LSEEISINSNLMKKLDEIQNEYARKNKLLKNDNENGDIYFKEKSDSENLSDLIDCTFKEGCGAFRFNTGNCPCELRR